MALGRKGRLCAEFGVAVAAGLGVVGLGAAFVVGAIPLTATAILSSMGGVGMAASGVGRFLDRSSKKRAARENLPKPQ